MAASDYIYFERDLECETGKTQKWNVMNRRHEIRLGVIQWYGAWRQYTFVVCSASVILNPDCMRLIADKCESLTKSHRLDKKQT